MTLLSAMIGIIRDAMPTTTKQNRNSRSFLYAGALALTMGTLLVYGLPVRFSTGPGVALLGCTPPPKCYDGILPFDNQTGVEIDTVITLDSSPSPAMDSAP